jgi:hypothetical protein
MSLRAFHWLGVFVGLVASACVGEETARPGVDASPLPIPDASVPLPDAAPPDVAMPDAAPFCGDGVRQDAEECDRLDFGGRTCVDEGYYEGQLACRPECKVEASGCSGRCGDGVINGPERCDDALHVTGTCRSRGFLAGTVACTAGCVLQGCRNFSLNNEEIVLGGRDDTSRLGASLAFAGDVDGDGRDELLAAAPGEVRVLGKKGAVYLVPGTSEGRATINNAARFVDDSWQDPDSLELEVAPARDLDGDGRPDFLIVARTDGGILDVYLIYGRPEPFTGTLKLADLVESGAAARFSIAPALVRPGRLAALGVPDVSGDGRPDLLVAVAGHGDGVGAMYVIPGDPVRYSGTLVLPAPVAPLPRPVHAVIVGSVVDGLLGNDFAVGDLDGDGVADLFVTGGGDVHVFYGPIEGVLSPADAAAHTDLGAVTSLAVADLDGDQDAELVVTTGASSGGFLFRGGPARRQGPLLADAADLRLGTTERSRVRVGGDVDGDGHRELIVIELSLTTVGIVPGPIAQTDFLSLEGDSVRWGVNIFHEQEDPVDVSLGDFNGDGFDDVAVSVARGQFGADQGVVEIIHGATPPTP